MNDKTAVFVRSFPVGKHTVTMILTRRRFLVGRVTFDHAQAATARYAGITSFGIEAGK